MAYDAGQRAEFVSASRILPEAVVSAVGYQFTGATPGLHRGLPSPSLTLVIGLDQPIVTGTSPEQALGPDADRQNVVLGGMHTRPAYIAQPSAQSGIQLAIHPLASRALFGVPAGQLHELITDGVDVLGKPMARLRDQIGELITWQERFSVLSRYLRHRWEAPVYRHEPRPEVVAAWQWIVSRRGTGAMDELARHVLLSKRQLTTLFRAELGLAPKAMSKLMRFEHARQLLIRAVRTGAPLNIADVAYRCGYYDHAHLVADFHQYADTSPSGWIGQEHQNIQGGAQQENAELPS